MADTIVKPMTREQATRLTHETLMKHSLTDWHVRLNTKVDARYVGLCLHKDKAIVLNAHHIDIHPEDEVRNTIFHEVAHALTPGHGHDDVWAAKAREIGCDNTLPCMTYGLSPEVIDAIRSGADVEMTVEEQVIRTPKYKITRLQDKCPHCGKVAKTVSENRIEIKEETKPDLVFIKLECGHTLIKNIPKGTPFHQFQMGGDKNCKHEWNKNTCVLCDRKRPFPFQIEGMQFGEAALSVNRGVAIFDEMGLGKTIQALGILKYHPELHPFLIIVKSAIKFQWFKAALDWMGDDFVCQIINTSSDILIPGLKGYIISYDLMVPKTKKLKSGKISQQGFDVEKILKSNIKSIVLDECQQVKNPDSGRTQQVKRIAKDRTVIALSGTPWKNRGGELAPVFQMIAPMKFPSHQGFLDKWVDFYWQGQYRKQGGIKNPTAFKEYVKDIAIRRERKEVMPELPITQRTKLVVKMTPDETKVYDDAVADFVEWYTNEEESAKSGINILGKISRLRHLTGIAKIPATLDYIDEFMEENDKKLVVFAHHQDVQESLYQACKARYVDGKKSSDDDDNGSEPVEKIPVFKLTGDMNAAEKFVAQNQFNAHAKCILIASSLAGGEGVNLQTGANCVMHERQWNPGNEEQAESRFCRIGQKAPEILAVYAQIIESIDDYLDQVVEKKRRWFHAGMNTGEAPKWNQDEILKELADIIVRKHREKNPPK